MAKRISTSAKIVNEILDKGLLNSTWREKHQQAYRELLDFRADIEASVRDVLLKDMKRIIQSYKEI